MTSIRTENIPQELIGRRQWLCWKWEERIGEKTSEIKWTKVPYQTNGRKASSTDDTTWTSFVTAIAAVSGFDGIGFVVTENDPYVGVDLDHCVDPDYDRVEPWAREHVESLNSYTEITPSNTGLRVWFKAKLPAGGRKKGDFECYDKARFFTVTGKHLSGTPLAIEGRQAEMDRKHDEIFGKQAQPETPPATSTSLDDTAVLKKARAARNGEKFDRLWAGDTSGHPSSSEADLALCSHLAFWTGGDATRIDNLYRQSGLLRDKWDEKHGLFTYGVMTFNEAVEGATEFYSDHANGRTLIPANDVGLTKRLSDAICEVEYFAQDAGGKLYVYDHGRYVPYGDRRIKTKVKSLLDEWGESKSWSVRRSSEVLEYIRVDAPFLWERPEEGKLNVQNGILDLNTRELAVHSPEILSQVQLPVQYDPEAVCPAWEIFVSETFPEDAQDLAWEIPALTMADIYHIQKALLLIGEGGNGKSTYLAGLRVFLGLNNTASMSLHKIETDKFAAAGLLGKLANICSDLPTTHLDSTSMFKAITGGDRIHAEYKYRDGFDFAPFARLIFSANHPPRSRDGSHAFFRRWDVIPFERTFEDAEQIPRDILDAQLADSGELSGVLNHALRVYRRVSDHGLTQSNSMKAALAEFRQTTDPLAVWLENHTLDDADAIVSKEALANAYNARCAQDGRPFMAREGFGRNLKRIRPDLTDLQRMCEGKLRWCWIGIGLKSEKLA